MFEQLDDHESLDETASQENGEQSAENFRTQENAVQPTTTTLIPGSSVGGPMLQSSIVSLPPPLTNKKRVTIVVEQSKDEEQEDGDRKKNREYKPSQLRIKRKIKELFKKINKYRHVHVDKKYGQELADREDDDGGMPEDENDTISEKVEENTEIADEDVTFDQQEDDQTEKTDDEKTDVDDSDDNGTDVEDDKTTADDEREDTSEADAEMYSEETIATRTYNDVDSDARIDFGKSSMATRFAFYKTVLEGAGMDFGDVSEFQNGWQ
jgi:hypothetical protein